MLLCQLLVHAWSFYSNFHCGGKPILTLMQVTTEYSLQTKLYHVSWCLAPCASRSSAVLKSTFTLKYGPGPRFNMKMASYQYRKSHCGDKTILQLSYLHNGISYTGKMTSLYWIRALVFLEGRFLNNCWGRMWTGNILCVSFAQRVKTIFLPQ